MPRRDADWASRGLPRLPCSILRFDSIGNGASCTWLACRVNELSVGEYIGVALMAIYQLWPKPAEVCCKEGLPILDVLCATTDDLLQADFLRKHRQAMLLEDDQPRCPCARFVPKSGAR